MGKDFESGFGLGVRGEVICVVDVGEGEVGELVGWVVGVGFVGEEGGVVGCMKSIILWEGFGDRERGWLFVVLVVEVVFVVG